MQTSNRASIIDADKVSLRPDPLGLLREYKAGTQRLVVAGRVSGDIKTAFPGGWPKPEEPKKDGDKPVDKSGDKPAGDKPAGDRPPEPKAPADAQITAGKLNAIIVADSDFLHDQFWVDTREFLGQQIQIPLAQNSVLVVNAIENLTGGEALRDLRGRGVKPRPFQVVDDIRRDAEKKFREKELSLRDQAQGDAAEARRPRAEG